ncbi:MAG TPA: MBL fold metallo-hydrolase [Thermodesulfobacteriota bacterium]|nr:MBL fold metallo-hydrolase [Thermodesulfobacteriota bacterium]
MKVHVIDHNFFRPKVISSYFVENNGEPILIETGPDTTFANLEKSLNDLGYSFEDIKNVFVTHIHLDHSGAAWRFAEAGATIYVHPKGAKHLIDPQRLVESARMLFKDQMDELWGEIKPIAEGRIHVTNDRETVKVGDLEIHTIETQGHASHHNAYVVDDVAFVGDVGGIRIEDGPVMPPTPPPDVNVEVWQESINKLREVNPQVLYATHFGGATDVKEHLEELESRLLATAEWVGERLKKGRSEDDMIAEYERDIRNMLKKSGVTPENIESYNLADFFWMNVSGLVRYWKKFRL